MGEALGVSASGFYEWKKLERGKQPFAIVPTDEPIFAFAGLPVQLKMESELWIQNTTTSLTA